MKDSVKHLNETNRCIILHKCVFTKKHKLTSSILINVANWFWENFGKKKLSALLATSVVFTLTTFESRQCGTFRRSEIFFAQLELSLRSRP
jgi:hypothetical protein